jgi:hypothetical protein
MPNLPKTIFNLAAELVKYQAKKIFGDGFINELSDSLADLAGESVSEKINTFLEQDKNVENPLMAFKDADSEFYREGDDIQR